MSQAKINSPQILKGSELIISIIGLDLKAYSTESPLSYAAEICDVGVLNPFPQAGTVIQASQKVAHEEGRVNIKVNTAELSAGFYEIRHLKLKDFVCSSSRDPCDLNRLLFEVVDLINPHRSKLDILFDVGLKEIQIQEKFFSPVDVRKSKDGKKIKYSCIVFICDLLIGRRTRFENFEVIPTGGGLDSQDELNFVNWALTNHTNTGVQFNYEEAMKFQARTNRPVCVIHFPNIMGSNFEEAYAHCVEQANKLILALALSRDAAGSVFDVVVQNTLTSESKKFSRPNNYVGNRVISDIGFDSPELLRKLHKGIELDPMNSFLVGLYREARCELNNNFRYVRFWQILETMAENKNYDKNLELLDFEGNVMKDEKSKIMFKRGTRNIVFSLLQDDGVAGRNTLWEDVNIWKAFRDSVAHHGSIENYSKLSNEDAKKWAEFALNKIKETNYDHFIHSLKDNTKFLLMNRLIKSVNGTGLDKTIPANNIFELMPTYLIDGIAKI